MPFIVRFFLTSVSVPGSISDRFNGLLAQLVQSAALTEQRSLVRAQCSPTSSALALAKAGFAIIPLHTDNARRTSVDEVHELLRRAHLKTSDKTPLARKAIYYYS